MVQRNRALKNLQQILSRLKKKVTMQKPDKVAPLLLKAKIVNSYTGSETQDRVGSAAELKYYRVMIEGRKHFFDSEGQYAGQRVETYGDDDTDRIESNELWPRPLRWVNVQNYRGPSEEEMATIRPFNQAASTFSQTLREYFPMTVWLPRPNIWWTRPSKSMKGQFCQWCLSLNHQSGGTACSNQSTVFEIPSDHFATLYNGLNDTNKQIIDKYMRNMAILSLKADQEIKDMAERIRGLKETQAFKQFEGLFRTPSKFLVC